MTRSSGSNARLFFLASDNPKPSGGLKFIYRFCEMACEMGYDAAVMHGNAGFQIENFEHSAPVVHHSGWKKRSRRDALQEKVRKVRARLNGASRQINVTTNDIIIVPENRLFRANEIFPDTRKIVLCQNPFLSARQGSSPPGASILGAIGISDITVEVIHRLLPDTPVFKVPLWIDPGMFSPSREKRRRLVYMPRRNGDEARMVLNLLLARGVLNDFELIPLDGVTVDEVGKTLHENLIFLSFAGLEGFGLPGAEAIASGCLTIGYTGIGGDEFFSRFGGWAIAQQDIVGYADSIAEVIMRYKEDSDAMDDARMAHAKAILDHYKRSKTRAALEMALSALVPDARTT